MSAATVRRIKANGLAIEFAALGALVWDPEGPVVVADVWEAVWLCDVVIVELVKWVVVEEVVGTVVVDEAVVVVVVSVVVVLEVVVSVVVVAEAEVVVEPVGVAVAPPTSWNWAPKFDVTESTILMA
jgi:hypothetical protein